MRTLKSIWYFLSLTLLSLSCSTADIQQSINVPVNVSKPVTSADNGQALFNYLALGDSYTVGASVPQKQSFPSQLTNRLEEELATKVQTEIIAVSGWRTDNLLNAIDERETNPPYDLVSLLIGVNNQYQNVPFSKYEEEFPVLLKNALQLAGARAERVVVISIPDWAYTSFGQGFDKGRISQEINAYNQYAESIAMENEVLFIYITDITRMGLDNPELIATDNLHPSGKAYGKFVERILPSILPALKN